MYLPAQFKSDSAIHVRALVREHPLASLVSNDDDGAPFITHLPLHLHEAPGAQDELAGAVLLGHVARANPHWRYLQTRPRALVTFLGPHAYLSPDVYPDLVRVPTWNYLALHCTVSARLVDVSDDKDRLLKHLIGDHEPAYADQWRSLDEQYTQAMLRGIVAFELKIERMQCKLKLNQHRPEAHSQMYQRYAQGGESEKALAMWMQRLGMVGDDGSVPAPSPALAT